MDYNNDSLCQDVCSLECYVDEFGEHVHWVRWSDSVLNHLLNGLDDDLLIILMLLDVYGLSLDFINRVL